MNINIVKPALAGLILGVSSLAHAGMITNGDFESGNLSGWTTTSGQVSIAAGISGAFGAYLDAESNVDAITLDELDTFFGLSVGAIGAQSLCAPLNCFTGQGMFQTINVAAGDVISFDWNASLESGSNYNDAVFFVAGNDVVFLTNGNNGGLNTNTNTSYTFTNTTSIKIGFGVVNGGDDCCDADLLVDNITISEIPEPSTLAIFALGIMGLVSRRYKKQ